MPIQSTCSKINRFETVGGKSKPVHVFFDLIRPKLNDRYTIRINVNVRSHFGSSQFRLFLVLPIRCVEEGIAVKMVATRHSESYESGVARAAIAALISVLGYALRKTRKATNRCPSVAARQIIEIVHTLSAPFSGWRQRRAGP